MSGDDGKPADDEAEVDRIRRRIESLVADRFAAGEDTYYLSNLGEEIGDDRKVIERLTAKKFSQFIESQFAYEIGRTGMHRNVLFIRRPGADESSPPGAKPRYRGRFWAAFAVPLEGEVERYINLETLRFGPDRDDISAGGGEVRPIAAKYVSIEGQPNASDDILGRIDLWLHEQGLEPGRFLSQRRRGGRASEETLLTALLTALSGDQLKRISLPLDVIKVLGDHRIG